MADPFRANYPALTIPDIQCRVNLPTLTVTFTIKIMQL